MYNKKENVWNRIDSHNNIRKLGNQPKRRHSYCFILEDKDQRTLNEINFPVNSKNDNFMCLILELIYLMSLRIYINEKNSLNC